MDKVSKMDLHGVRTATDIERKYNFGKSFAEVTGIATDARNLAEQAVHFEENLTQEEIFNRLTNNGEAHGIFKDDEGQIYINGAYIKNVAALFVHDILMTGTFTNTAEAYFVPGEEEMATLQAHILGQIVIPDELIPKYDFNGDGVLTSQDLRQARAYQLGLESFQEWVGAVATTATITIDMTNPERAIHFTGKNMWGRDVDGYVGVNFTSARCPETEQRIDDLEQRIAALEAAQTNLGGDENGS